MEELPTIGQVFVCGYESKYIRRKDIPRLRRKLGIVFQDFRLLYDRNVFENVAFAMRVTGMRERVVKRKVWEVLAQTGLSHKSLFYPSQLLYMYQEEDLAMNIMKQLQLPGLLPQQSIPCLLKAILANA